MNANAKYATGFGHTESVIKYRQTLTNDQEHIHARYSCCKHGIMEK